MSLMIHQIISLLFISILPLPIITLIKSRNDGVLHYAHIWKILVMVANVGLFGSLITGLLLYHDFTSIQVWISIVLILALGAFLGIFSKQLKLYQLERDQNIKQKHLKKITKIGFFYIATVIILFALMSNWYMF